MVIEPQFGVGGVELVEKGGFSKVKIPPRNKNCSKREERERSSRRGRFFFFEGLKTWISE